jgi:hypothetical protein
MTQKSWSQGQDFLLSPKENDCFLCNIQTSEFVKSYPNYSLLLPDDESFASNNFVDALYSKNVRRSDSLFSFYGLDYSSTSFVYRNKFYDQVFKVKSSPFFKPLDSIDISFLKLGNSPDFKFTSNILLIKDVLKDCLTEIDIFDSIQQSVVCQKIIQEELVKAIEINSELDFEEKTFNLMRLGAGDPFLKNVSLGSFRKLDHGWLIGFSMVQYHFERSDSSNNVYGMQEQFVAKFNIKDNSLKVCYLGPCVPYDDGKFFCQNVNYSTFTSDSTIISFNGVTENSIMAAQTTFSFSSLPKTDLFNFRHPTEMIDSNSSRAVFYPRRIVSTNEYSYGFMRKHKKYCSNLSTNEWKSIVGYEDWQIIWAGVINKEVFTQVKNDLGETRLVDLNGRAVLFFKLDCEVIGTIENFIYFVQSKSLSRKVYKVKLV